MKLHIGRENVSTLPEFFTYILESKLFKVNDLQPSLYNLQNPEFYSFSILNDQLKSNIIDKLSKVKFSSAINNQLQNVVASLKNTTYNEHDLQEFKKVTTKYDVLRNRNFLKTFPELKELFET